MEPSDSTIQLLEAIRDELRATRAELCARLDETNARLDEANVRLHEVKTELARRIVESEVHTGAALDDLAGTVRDVTEVLRKQDPRVRIERCERDLAELKRGNGG